MYLEANIVMHQKMYEHLSYNYVLRTGVRGGGGPGEASLGGQVPGSAQLPRSIQPDLQHFPLPQPQVIVRSCSHNKYRKAALPVLGEVKDVTIQGI